MLWKLSRLNVSRVRKFYGNSDKMLGKYWKDLDKFWLKYVRILIKFYTCKLWRKREKKLRTIFGNIVKNIIKRF